MATTETIRAMGHPNIRATHRSTIEITTENFLTPRGDCIVGVSADHSVSDLRDSFKNRLRKGASLTILMEAGGYRDLVHAEGSPYLTLSDSTSMVIRKSGFICPRTLCIHADKAAADLNRGLISALARGEPLRVTLSIS